MIQIDMPMPPTCNLCRFHEIEWEWNNEHHSRCQVNKKRIPTPSKNDYPKGKPKWCPLIEATLMDDGTLIVKADDIEKVGRVMIKDDSVFCKMFYEE